MFPHERAIPRGAAVSHGGVLKAGGSAQLGVAILIASSHHYSIRSRGHDGQGDAWFRIIQLDVFGKLV